MRLTDMYNLYKSETDANKRAIVKGIYIYNGGKKLELDSGLELAVYKTICGLAIVKKVLENSYKRDFVKSNRVKAKYKVEDIARILIKSMAPEYINIENLEVGDNGNSFVIRFKGCSKITGKCYDNRFIMKTSDDESECIRNFVWVENQLVIQLFDIMGYTNVVDLMNTINGYMVYIDVSRGV